MRRVKITFVDDDQDELDTFHEAFGTEYQVLKCRWRGLSHLGNLGWLGNPDVIVSDMYLPKGASDERIPDKELESQEDKAWTMSGEFPKLYRRHRPRFPRDDKRRLQTTMRLLESARKRLLDAQWRAMGQSPKHGFAFLQAVKGDKKYRSTPVIFYSRKITVENAVDAMRKGAPPVRKGQRARLRAEVRRAVAKKQSL
jgi:DNA-binding NtrC family response regulator